MKFHVVLASLALAFPMVAQAQSTDPVDRNNAGPYVGLGLNLGQSHGVGFDDNGTAYLIGADIGYVLKRDTWNRIELGVELQTGKAKIGDDVTNPLTGNKLSADVDLDLDLVALFKVGYGYSLGDHAFGIFRAGFGIANGDAELKMAGLSGSNDIDGTVAMLGYDVVFPANETLDFTVGVNYRIYTLDVEGNNFDDLQLNVTALNAGARLRF